MAQKFSERGFVVFLFDLRGFGDSEDPVSLKKIDDILDVQDVFNAVEYFREDPTVNKNRLFLVGHSYGGSLAVQAMATGANVNKIVVIGPARRVKERSAIELSCFIKRYSADRKIGSLIPLDVFEEFSAKQNIDTVLPYYRAAKHKPLFLIDGKLEGLKDREYLKAYFDKMSPPKKYCSVEGTAHYLNTLHLFGSSILVYDGKMMDSVVTMIVEWLQTE